MDKDQTKRRRRKRNAVIITAIIILIILLLLLFRGCSRRGGDDITPLSVTNPGIVYDLNAVQGGWEEADTSEIIDSLNHKVEEGMINISMNTTPTFPDGASAGNLMIVNESVNTYPQVIEITRNDTGELIYQSGAIPVGSKIESAMLNSALPAGEYGCTAFFYNVDPETGAYLGCAGAIINITILN